MAKLTSLFHRFSPTHRVNSTKTASLSNDPSACKQYPKCANISESVQFVFIRRTRQKQQNVAVFLLFAFIAISVATLSIHVLGLLLLITSGASFQIKSFIYLLTTAEAGE